MAEEIVSSTAASASASTSSSSGRKRGRGIAIGDSTTSLGAGVKLDIVMNENGEACSEYTAQLASWIGIQARTAKMLPLCYKTWKKVPEHHKDDAFKKVQEKFNLGNGSRKFIYKQLNKRWREFKHELKKEVYYKYSTDAERRAHLDKRVDAAQWDYLLKVWNSEESKAIATRNTENREKQHMTKTTGRTSYACINEDLRSNHPEGLYPSRFDVFKRVHTRKDGSVSDPVSKEKMAEMDSALNDKPEEQQNDKTVKETIFTSVIGPDNHGRMRMVSHGPTPKDLYGRTAMRAANLAKVNEQLCGKISQLENEMTQQKQTMEERLAQMQEEMTSQSYMLTQLMRERQNL